MFRGSRRLQVGISNETNKHPDVDSACSLGPTASTRSNSAGAKLRGCSPKIPKSFDWAAWIASCCFVPSPLPQKPATVTEKKQQLGYLGVSFLRPLPKNAVFLLVFLCNATKYIPSKRYFQAYGALANPRSVKPRPGGSDMLRREAVMF